MCTSNPVRSVRGSQVTGLPCWSSHTFLVGQGILILISILQDATALSPLINSMSLSSPLALQQVQYFLYSSRLHLLCQRPHTQVWNPYWFLSLDMSKQVFSACTLTELTAVHFSSQNYTPVLFLRIQFCFSIAQFENSNCIINWNVSSSNLTS